MIAVAVRDYDDENIAEECETGWRRFCAEVLVRTHAYILELSNDHRRLGSAGMRPYGRKGLEHLRRQVSAYRWVFHGTGGEFTFDSVCRDLRLDAGILRRKYLSLCRPAADINLLVEWVASKQERSHGKGRGQNPSARGLGTSIVAAVRNLRSENGKRTGRRGAQTHAVCRRKDGLAGRRRPAGADRGRPLKSVRAGVVRLRRRSGDGSGKRGDS